jgi:hypothetical protein
VEGRSNLAPPHFRHDDPFLLLSRSQLLSFTLSLEGETFHLVGRWMFDCFGVLIAACGATHVMDVRTFLGSFLMVFGGLNRGKLTDAFTRIESAHSISVGLALPYI